MSIEFGQALDFDQTTSHDAAFCQAPRLPSRSGESMVAMTTPDNELVEWLLEGDPSLRWRVHQDLIGSSASTVRAERAKVAMEGWGAKLISLQDPDGRWGGGDYTPKWTSTTYTLLHLAWLGIPPGNSAALAGCERLWEWQSRWRVPETCIVSILVRLTVAHGYHAERLDELVDYLLGQQLNDGGWNCAARGDRGKHSSFHTSIQALEALHAYQRAGGRAATEEAQGRGREFFLRHQLYKSHRTGQIAVQGSTRFPQLPQWHFDVLRGLEYFVDAAPHHDQRLTDAVEVLRHARRTDGRWPTYAGYPGRTWFRMEQSGPSRWNTMRALRVLSWWEAAG
jgi:hypothetical protein